MACDADMHLCATSLGRTQVPCSRNVFLAVPTLSQLELVF